jgi:hypothetical protein
LRRARRIAGRLESEGLLADDVDRLYDESAHLGEH